MMNQYFASVVGSMVESGCRGASCHAYSSHWTNQEGDDKTVHCEGTFSFLLGKKVPEFLS